jgi:hypothetical protein
MTKPEIFDGTNWIKLGSGDGTVTSVDINGSNGLTVAGSPITTNGTIYLTLDVELQGISSLNGLGILTRLSNGNYIERSIISGTGINIINSNGVSGNPSINLTTQLQNLNNLNTLGFVTLTATGTGASTFANRTLLAGTGISITNADGASGNPTFSLTTQLQNLNNLNSLGFVALSATGVGSSSFVNRTLSAGTGININNGNGVSGNPSISLGTVPVSLLSGYPANSSLFLRGDGIWSSVYQTNIALTGAVIGSGSSSIATTLNNYQTMVGSNLSFDWTNNGSFAEYSNYHTLEDSNPPPHFVHKVQCGSGNTYRRWLTVYQPGSSSILNATYEINFYHTINGYQYPFKIKMYNSSLRTYFGTTVDMQNNEIINAAYPTTSSSLATRGYVDSLINTNSNTKITSYESGYQIYMRASSNYLDLRGAYVYSSRSSAIIETNSNNETAAIVMNGDFIQTIQTFDNLGFIFTDEDTNPQSSWQSYISYSGSLITSSSKKKKHSIRKKEHKNYLERLNKLNIYSYALKTPILNNDNEKTKIRKYFKNKQLHLGLLSEEVEELFDNCTDNFKIIEFDKNNKKEIKESIKDYTPKVDEQEYIKFKNKKRKGVIGVKYDSLLCYTILAIQELSKKVELLKKEQIK